MENTYIIRFVDRDSSDWDIYITIKTDKNFNKDILPLLIEARKDWYELWENDETELDEFNYVARTVLVNLDWTETRIENVGW